MDRIKIRNRHDINIKRNAIEKILMFIKDFLKKNRKIVLRSLVAILILVAFSIAAYIYLDKRSLNLLVKYEAIMEKYSNADSAIEGIEEETIKELNELRAEARFGYVYEMTSFSIANFYYTQGKFNDAAKLFEEFASDTSSDFYASLALLKAGSSFEESGNYNDALTIYKKLEKDYFQEPTADNIYYSLGRVYNRLGDAEQSRKYYEKVVADFPGSAFAENAKKRIYLIKEKKEQVN